MYKSSNDGGYGFGVDYGVTLFVNAGLSRNKIIVGSAGYGKAYKVTGTVNQSSKYPGLGVRGTLTQISGLTGSYSSGTLFGNAIDTLIAGGKYVKYIEYNSSGKIVSSFLYSETDKIFVTYESEEVITAKYEFIKNYNGMGIMSWAYTEDTADRYINSIYEAIN
jgi:GH18 family chitinase